MIMSFEQRKIKIKPRIKLNHNIYIPAGNHYNHFSTPVALMFWGPGLRSVKLDHFSGFRKNLLAYLLAEILFP